VGAEYEPLLKDALDDVPENTPDKEKRLAYMARTESAGESAAGFALQRRWMGEQIYLTRNR